MKYGSLSTKTVSLDTFEIDGVEYPFTPREQLNLDHNQRLMRFAVWQLKLLAGTGMDTLTAIANTPVGETLAMHEDLIELVPQLLRTAPEDLLASLYDQGRREIVAAFLLAIGVIVTLPTTVAEEPKTEETESPPPIPIGTALSLDSKPSTKGIKRAGGISR